jgi:DNA-binding NtrC family response regulator
MARILVIDDEPMIGEIASRILIRAGHEVLTALSGQDGIHLLENGDFDIDVLLIDETMPGLSAKETISMILSKHPNVQTIISSGYKVDFEGYRREFGDSVSTLPKPYRSEQLNQAVTRSLTVPSRN